MGFKKVNKIHKCTVCGHRPAWFNFGAITCGACCIFFRRHQYADLNIEKCSSTGNCKLNLADRRCCRHCRLKKCLNAGMHRAFFHSTYRSSHKTGGRFRKDDQQLITLGVSDNTYNIPMSDEQRWILSNAVTAFNICLKKMNIEHTIAAHTSYPLKLRFKTAYNSLASISGSVAESIIPYIRCIPHFSNLAPEVVSMILERNMKTLVIYTTYFIYRRVNLCSDHAYRKALEDYYGSSYTEKIIQLVTCFEMDETMFSLVFIVLCFSTNLDIVEWLQKSSSVTQQYNSSSLSAQLFVIQNIYIEIAFKQMLHQYNNNYRDASKHLLAMIKNILDLFIAVNEYHENQAKIKFPYKKRLLNTKFSIGLA